MDRDLEAHSRHSLEVVISPANTTPHPGRDQEDTVSTIGISSQGTAPNQVPHPDVNNPIDSNATEEPVPGIMDSMLRAPSASSSTASPKHSATLSWDDVWLQIKDKTVLHPSSGVAKPGRILAIMGPSGSGKTSLLHCLAGRMKKMKGGVFLNGKVNDGKSIRQQAAFVAQDDFLYGFLTVEESIRFAADLQLDKSRAQRQEMIEKAIVHSGLANVRNKKIGSVVVRGIAGGEKRRASIATEVVAGKPLIFLDEPTTGLDSAAAFHVVTMLKRLARENGTTIVTTIHQPNSKIFDLIDDLLILSYGQAFYFGPAKNLGPHLGELGRPCPDDYTAVEYAVDLINADFLEHQHRSKAKTQIAQLCHSSMAQCPCPERAELSNDPSDIPVVLPHNNGVHPLKQLLFLLKRGYINSIRNWLVYWVRAAMFVALGLLQGTVWYDVGNSYSSVQNRFSVLFFTVAFPCFMAVAGIPGFLEERAVVVKEIRGGSYSPLVYTIATTFVSIPFLTISCVLFEVITYNLHGFRTSDAGPYFTFLAIFLSVIWCAEAFMLIFPALVPIFIIALTLAAFGNGFIMMLQGFFVPFSDIPKFWVWGHYWSYQKYAFEALAKNEFTGLVFNCPNTTTGCNCGVYFDDLAPQCQFRGETVLAFYGYEDVSIGGWTLVLLGMAVAYRIIFWGLLSWSVRRGMQ